MAVITGGEKPSISQVPYYKRMIRCPGHWLVPPTVDVFLREPVAELRHCSDFVEYMGRKIKIQKERIVKDMWGRKIINWKRIRELRQKGVIKTQFVSAAWAIEHVYDPLSALCNTCPKFCKKGQGRILIHTIRRLNGIPMKHR